MHEVQALFVSSYDVDSALLLPDTIDELAAQKLRIVGYLNVHPISGYSLIANLSLHFPYWLRKLQHDALFSIGTFADCNMPKFTFHMQDHEPCWCGQMFDFGGVDVYEEPVKLCASTRVFFLRATESTKVRVNSETHVR